MTFASPWWIPATLIAELTGMALVLAAQEPRYLSSGKWLKDGGSGD